MGRFRRTCQICGNGITLETAALPRFIMPLTNPASLCVADCGRGQFHTFHIFHSPLRLILQKPFFRMLYLFLLSFAGVMADEVQAYLRMGLPEIVVYVSPPFFKIIH